jgi:hypothetical protein
MDAVDPTEAPPGLSSGLRGPALVDFRIQAGLIKGAPDNCGVISGEAAGETSGLSEELEGGSWYLFAALVARGLGGTDRLVLRSGIAGAIEFTTGTAAPFLPGLTLKSISTAAKAVYFGEGNACLERCVMAHDVVLSGRGGCGCFEVSIVRPTASIPDGEEVVAATGTASAWTATTSGEPSSVSPSAFRGDVIGETAREIGAKVEVARADNLALRWLGGEGEAAIEFVGVKSARGEGTAGG